MVPFKRFGTVSYSHLAVSTQHTNVTQTPHHGMAAQRLCIGCVVLFTG